MSNYKNDNNKIKSVIYNFIYAGFYMFSFLGLIFLLNLEGDIFEKNEYNNNRNNNNNIILDLSFFTAHPAMYWLLICQ